MPIRVKRAYDPPDAGDGFRVLVDRLWPRGLSRESAALDEWRSAAAPSAELRRWFGHDPAKWDDFCRRYWAELEARPEAWRPLLDRGAGVLTLLYGAREPQFNNAAALEAFLERQIDG